MTARPHRRHEEDFALLALELGHTPHFDRVQMPFTKQHSNLLDLLIKRRNDANVSGLDPCFVAQVLHEVRNDHRLVGIEERGGVALPHVFTFDSMKQQWHFWIL